MATCFVLIMFIRLVMTIFCYIFWYKKKNIHHEQIFTLKALVCLIFLSFLCQLSDFGMHKEKFVFLWKKDNDLDVSNIDLCLLYTFKTYRYTPLFTACLLRVLCRFWGNLKYRLDLNHLYRNNWGLLKIFKVWPHQIRFLEAQYMFY